MTQWARPPWQREQMVLFAERLDDALPANHAVRLLDELLAELDWSRWEDKYHARLGQPAIHPRVMASVLLYGLLTRVGSSRALEEALQLRMDFRWLAEGRSIDHTTLSEFRRQHSNELKDLFLQVCQVARRLGLVTLLRLGFDGTRVRANNRRSGTRTPEQLRLERAELEAKFAEFTAQAEAEDARDEEVFGLKSPQELPPELADEQQRRKKIAAALAQVKAAEEELERAEKAGESLPKRLPITDCQSRLMPDKEGSFAPNYTPTAMVDIGSGLIVDADVLQAINEDGQLVPAIENVQQQFGLEKSPPEVLADGLMATGANLAALEERGIAFYSPCSLPDPAMNPALRNDPTQPVAESDWDRLPLSNIRFQGKACQQLDKAAFVYDAQKNCYWCPLGKALPHVTTTTQASRSGRRARARYKADPRECAACPLRARCLKGRAAARQINREQYEAHRERHARRMATPEARKIYAQRQHAGERPFAAIKHQFGLRRFLLRGLKQVRDEWRWATTAFNLQRLMTLLRSRAGPAAAAMASGP